jgi:MinD superfamily P-loop ATPase
MESINDFIINRAILVYMYSPGLAEMKKYCQSHGLEFVSYIPYSEYLLYSDEQLEGIQIYEGAGFFLVDCKEY